MLVALNIKVRALCSCSSERCNPLRARRSRAGIAFFYGPNKESGKAACNPASGSAKWAQRAGEKSPEVLPEYEASVGATYKMLAAVRGHSEGDPKRIADLILKLAYAEEVPKRLVLGRDAETYVKQAETARAEEASRYRGLTLSTSFPDSSAPPAY